jgi:superfamily I DNA and RNA helicase
MNMQFLPGSLEINPNPFHLEIWKLLTRHLRDLDGYCAYQIPVLGAATLSEIPTFIIVTKEHGVLLIDVMSEKLLRIEDDCRTWLTSEGSILSRDAVLEYYTDEIFNRFKRSPQLYNRRARGDDRNLVPIESLIILMDNTEEEINSLDLENELAANVATKSALIQHVSTIIPDEPTWQGTGLQFDDILSLIEGTWGYGFSAGQALANQELVTTNDFIQRSLTRTFKQDDAQRQVSMQVPNGPQRIRGLAGTGKTVVLCLKAALTALRLPEFKILYLFNTQSLYNLVEQEIGNYYAREAKRALPADAIDILHAWGGRTTGHGLYSKTCLEYGVRPLTLGEVRGHSDSLQAIYQQLLEKIGSSITPVYDMVLIDEAQDFPNEVFELVYKLTKDPKRIVIAYDDFQTLKQVKIREFSDLFGKNADGAPHFSAQALEGDYEGGVAKDFVLPNCYRNPRNTMMVAHGIALGLYREGGAIESIDLAADWKALGYNLISPNKDRITEGDQVVVERPDTNSTNLLEALLFERQKTPKHLIQVEILKTKREESEFIATKIDYLIKSQEVSPHEIFVVTIDTKNSENFLKGIRSRLDELGIRSIMPGFIESSRHFHDEGAVVLTTPFKAKGNEANIVFVANCEQVVSDRTFRKRNAFFVAVTRSRGWCYISGEGENMARLNTEIQSIQANIPQFKYQRPTDKLLHRSRSILAKPDMDIEKVEAILRDLAKNNPELLEEFIQQHQLDLQNKEIK